MNNKKTETKLSIDKNGDLLKTEVPVFEMPSEVKELNFEPNDDLILAEFVPYQEETKSGIIVPETAQRDKAPKALVIATGKDITKYTIGDVIVFKQGIMPTNIDGRIIFALNEYNVIGKYKK